MKPILQRRVSDLEGARHPDGRLIVVSVPPAHDASSIMADFAIEQRPRDLVVTIAKPAPCPAWARVHEGAAA